MRIKILAEAEKDLEDGYHFYESQTQVLEHIFLILSILTLTHFHTLLAFIK